MQPITLPLAALALVTAAEAPPPSDPDSQAQAATPAAQSVTPSDRQCRDVITQAREKAGMPPLLDREPASPDKPYHIYAVDRREAGCSVMVTAGNPADIRPLPAPSDGPMLVMPLSERR
ncbi:hypothetical protein [Porphyrobacter sp. ULC335]|uniref:hypothetical protein n=1 Tax=Porphyrobacter sp. ULC335 TaxID=2854260 RepID=UPI00221E8643|nr:hypothetical protein [Porphyrobacter sp. ULC335]UYV14779.1 hypothetical protein KVF90_11565 [Porphyrobacter sp. ULC335]